MAQLCMSASPISESDLFHSANSDSDFKTLFSPNNINARSCRQRKNEEDDDVASITTVGVDEVLGDREKTGHCLVRMGCLSASSGSSYSPYYDEEPRHHSSWDATDGQEPRDMPDWRLLKKSIDYPESVGWDSNSETQYSRSETYAPSAYVKIALSSEIKSTTHEGEAFLPRQVRLGFTPSPYSISRDCATHRLDRSSITHPPCPPT